MFAEERQSRICQFVREHARASVSELARAFGVSEATIRRDLKELEQGEKLLRTHGGAIAREGVAFEPSIAEKAAERAEEKERIAREALTRIGEGETVILDSGTTTGELARLLFPVRGLTVVTNSASILATLLGAEGVELVSTGGILRKGTQSMVGPFAEGVLRSVTADQAFIGTNALDADAGLTTPNLIEAGVKRLMLRAAREVTLLCDHGKIGKRAFAKVAELEEIDRIITGREAPDSFVREAEERGVEVIRV